MRSILFISIMILTISCDSQRIDLLKIPLKTSIKNFIDIGDSLNVRESYYMMSRKNGFRVANLEKFKLGNLKLNGDSQFDLSEIKYDDYLRNYIYFLYENENKDSLFAIGVSIQNIELSNKVLDYLFKNLGKTKNLFGGAMNKPDENGFIIDNLAYNWDNPNNDGKSYYVFVFYSSTGRNGKPLEQSLSIDLIIYDSSNVAYKKLLYENN